MRRQFIPNIESIAFPEPDALDFDESIESIEAAEPDEWYDLFENALAHA